MFLSIVMAAGIAAGVSRHPTVQIPFAVDGARMTVEAPAALPQEAKEALAAMRLQQSAREIGPGCVEVLAKAAYGASVHRGPLPRGQAPLWVPGANPYEGRYAAVNTIVNGCMVPRPISLPYAPPATGAGSSEQAQ